MKHIYVIILFLITFKGYTQEVDAFKQELGFKVGLRINEINDQRFASSTKSALSPIVAFEYQKNNSKRKELLSIAFNCGQTSSGGLLNFKWIHPEVNYTYQRKHNNVWIGGFFNSSTFLNFPIASSGQFNNNPISYTIAQSLGPALSYDKSLDDNSTWTFNSLAQVSLINYVIRPAYAHPYPEAFLNTESFDPTQKGMAKTFLKSGQFLTVN